MIDYASDQIIRLTAKRASVSPGNSIRIYHMLDHGQIRELQAGQFTDAHIENTIFGFTIQGSPQGPIVNDPQGEIYCFGEKWRFPRKFSTKIKQALKILDKADDWNIWKDPEGKGICARLSFKMPDNTWISGCGIDGSLALAICQGALCTMVMVREWRKEHEPKNKGQQKGTDERIETRQEKTPNAIGDR